MDELEKISKKRIYKKGDILFFAGDLPKKLLFLIDGEVEIYKSDLKGDEIVMGVFAQFSLIAEMPTLNNIPYPATARCKKDSTIYEIEINDELLSVLNQPIVKFFIDSMAKKIEKLENIISYLTITDARIRVAKYLYDNRTNLSDLSQRQIASNLRLTPEGLSRILKRFKDENIVSTVSKKLMVPDINKLKEMI